MLYCIGLHLHHNIILLCPVSVPLSSSTSIYSHIYKYSTSYSRIIRFASRMCSPLHACGHHIYAHGANINYLLRLIVTIIKIMIINSSSLVYNLICKESTNGDHHVIINHHHHQCRFLAHKTKRGIKLKKRIFVYIS